MRTVTAISHDVAHLADGGDTTRCGLKVLRDVAVRGRLVAFIFCPVCFSPS
jgi:hypothetical protein